MQHVNRFLEFGDLHYAVGVALIRKSQLPSTGPDLIEWLEIGWIKSRLNLARLKACLLAGANGKPEQVLVRRTDPTDLFFVAYFPIMYKNLYAMD